MFETAELGLKLSKDEFAREEPELRTELLRLQRELLRVNVPVVLLIHGLDGSGRGDALNLLHEWLDARFVHTYAPGEPTEEEGQRPEYWRYWMQLPSRGQIAICFGSWYSAPIRSRVYGDSNDAMFDASLSRSKAFEDALVDDGAILIKLWLHITEKQQKKHFKRIEKNPDAPWPVTKLDWKHHALYAEFRSVASRALRQTSTASAPWTVVEAADPRYRDISTVRHLVERLRQRLGLEEGTRLAVSADAVSADASSADASSADTSTHRHHAHALLEPSDSEKTVLDTLDLNLKLDKESYEERLAKAQARLNRLARKASRKPLSTILLFEGWDAAGKGGAIRRVAHALDARSYRLIPIAAPTDEEKAHHYLWRFWRHLPRRGRTTIYDRSWYGRVLVERVEGFATEGEWQRAYQEINDFEEQLADFGIVLVKFWIHISQDEQLRRFKERESVPWKKHKITEEDYRNRKKWPMYEAAVNDMVSRTSTEFAPWTLVEGDDKRFARVKVIETVCDCVQRALHG